MLAVHSLWTGTPQFRLHRGAMVVHTLSLCLAREHCAGVELVTDARGLRLAEAMGWRYTSYLNVLDRLTAGGLTHVWAMGKLVAIREQSEPFIQIDTDVLLHKPLPRHVRHARLCAQSIDYPEWYVSGDMETAVAHAGLRRGRVAYNCGVIGGTDLRLLHRYADEAITLARKFKDHPMNGTTVSMAVEQYQLGDFARRHHCRVETVLPLDHGPADYDRAGYTHLSGDQKRDPGKVDRAEAKLASHYPQAYARFVAGWEKLKGRHAEAVSARSSG